jgi:hypothetical protein
MIRRKQAAGSLLVAVLFLTHSAFAQTEAPQAGAVPGAADLAGAIAKNHPYLFPGELRSDLDEVNRLLREADSQVQKARSEEATRLAKRKRDAAAARLLALLQKCPGLINISLTGDKPTISATAPVMLPGDAGGLLFRIDAGPGRTSCATGQLNLSEPKGESSMVSLNIGAVGTTWAVVSLARVPTERTSLLVELNRFGKPKVRLPLDVRTPPPGRLRVTILSADSGKPAPAMVRLVWKTDGNDRMPANAIEFAPQFDAQGRASGRRGGNLPGKLGGYYWCVPGPFDMTVPPGEWEIAVRRGVEHVAAFDTFTVKPGEVVDKTYTPRRWIDMRKLGWYSGDDHVHCQILSDADAQRLMTYAQAEDLHLANVVKMGDIYRTYFEQRGFGKEYRVMNGDYVLSPGQECPRTHDQIGHTLAMNTTSMVRDTDRYFLYDTVFDAVHAQGGITGYAHANTGLFHVHRDMSINIPKKKVDFIEVLQFANLGTDLYYDFLNLGCKITASAGSDVPWGGTIGEVRAYAYIGDQPFSADAWFEAFKRGRTFTTDGPMLEFRVDDALPGDEITAKENRRLHVKARAIGDADTMPPVKLEIVRHGEVIRHVEDAEKNKKELTLEFDVDAGDGFWIAARAWAADGRKAHTTPVYVVREGLRFWKYDAVDALIAKRLTSLDEVEKLVADARQRDKAGTVEGDRTIKQLALQGPELLKRVEAARKIYAELRETAAKERPLRAAAK